MAKAGATLKARAKKRVAFGKRARAWIAYRRQRLIAPAVRSH